MSYMENSVAAQVTLLRKFITKDFLFFIIIHCNQRKIFDVF